MQEIPAFFKKKNVLVIAGIGGIILVVLFFLFIQNTNTQKSQNHQNAITEQPATTTIPGSSAIENIPQWNKYNGSAYQFEYPPDWQMQRTSVTGGGEIFLIKPNILTNNMQYPQLLIESVIGTNTMLQQKAGFLRALGLQQSQMPIFDTQAIKLHGTISSQQPIQETAILFHKGNAVYTFTYGYEDTKTNSLLEDYFMEMIDSFHFK